jgi:hypothetical protein
MSTVVEAKNPEDSSRNLIDIPQIKKLNTQLAASACKLTNHKNPILISMLFRTRCQRQSAP